MQKSSKPTPPHKVRVLIVDDHPMVRERLAEVVRAERGMELCGALSDGGQVLRDLAQHKPDVVLLDLNLKGVLAFDLIKDIHARHPSVPVLVVSMYDESIFAERALRAGAKGYINKEEPTPLVIEAIRKVLANETYVSQAMSARHAQAYVGGSDRHFDNALERLTDRELEVLELTGHGLTTRQIAEKLHIEMRTVETYRARIKEKLDLKTGTELLLRAVEWLQQQSPR
jgi:RNA polymerase sigma factor (sigma-70 family)